MKRIIGSAIAVLSLALVGASGASAAQTDMITTDWSIPTFPSAPPFTGSYAGTYSDTFGDSGTVTIQALLGAVPSPSTGVLQTLRTYSDERGDTLVLRCVQIASDFSNLSDVPNRGSCAVLSRRGDFAALSGAGKISGYASFTGTGAIVHDIVTLS